MPEDLEDIKNEINQFCQARTDQKSCVAGVLQGIFLSKKLMRENNEKLLEDTEDIITKKLL